MSWAPRAISSRSWVGAPTDQDEKHEIDLREVISGRSVTLDLPFAAIGPRQLTLLIKDSVSPIVSFVRGRVKRGLDFWTAFVSLLLALPVMIAIALAIKLTSPGPAIYKHERIGQGGKRFKVWKFRSMRTDVSLDDIGDVIAADEERADSPAYKSPNDPRITRVGRFIRRSGLDELPQFFNVLSGTMSLVGPRPLVDEEIAVLSPAQLRHRNSVPPGVTGLWQVFRRSDTTYEERIRLDLVYVATQSLWLDFYLLAMTPLALLKGERSF